MKIQHLGLLAVASLLLVSSLAVAFHLPPPPALSQGGELAYIRDLPTDTLDDLSAGDEVRGTYVTWGLDTHANHTDQITDLTSRGRMADMELFHQITLPKGVFTEQCFHAVQDRARGAYVGEGDAGRFVLFNGVNAGFGVLASEALELTLHVEGGHAITLVDNETVTLGHDGHTYTLEAHLGSITKHGQNLVVNLGAGGMLSGAINGFPATTQVTQYELDLARGIPSLC